MKTKLTALALATVTAFSFTPKPAQASDKGLAVLGGFIGGIIVASAINDSQHHGYYSDRDATVVVNDRYHGRNDRCDDARPSGYWRVVVVQNWVPGYWVDARDRNGCRVRRYVSGHYESRNDRVWVSTTRHGGSDRWDRDHDRRTVSSGYGRDRNYR